MFIIWGWRTFTTDYGQTLAMQCFNCHNAGYARLIRKRRWFTLFFIPIIPISSKYYMICGVCSQGNELSGNDIDHAIQLNKITQAYLNGEITELKYREFQNTSNMIMEQVNDQWECPNCQGRNGNNTFSCIHCGYKIV